MVGLEPFSSTTTSGQSRGQLPPALTLICQEMKLARALGVRVMFCAEQTNACAVQLLVIARSQTHNRALARRVRSMAAPHYSYLGGEGEAQGAWIALDYQELIIHLMDQDTFAIYDQDGLWNDMPGVDYHEA